MKYTLTDKTITILEHIVHVAEKTAKKVEFCFIKGKKQSYINPLQDIFVTFDLEESIKFDYAISNLKTFITQAVRVLDSDKNKTNKDVLFLPTKEHIRYFEGKSVIQTSDFTIKDLQNIGKFKHRYLNVIGENNKMLMRFQNHPSSWWFDDGNKKIFNIGKSSRKFRYAVKRERIRLLPNDYKLICKGDREGGVLRFQLRHLNYYFKSENFWHGQQVKQWVATKDTVQDKHLIALYKSKGYL